MSEAKSLFFQWCQSHKREPQFDVVSAGFVSKLRVKGIDYVGCGISTDKEEAQANSVKDFVEYLGLLPPPAIDVPALTLPAVDPVLQPAPEITISPERQRLSSSVFPFISAKELKRRERVREEFYAKYTALDDGSHDGYYLEEWDAMMGITSPVTTNNTRHCIEAASPSLNTASPVTTGPRERVASVSISQCLSTSHVPALRLVRCDAVLSPTDQPVERDVKDTPSEVPSVSHEVSQVGPRLGAQSNVRDRVENMEVSAPDSVGDKRAAGWMKRKPPKTLIWESELMDEVARADPVTEPHPPDRTKYKMVFKSMDSDEENESLERCIGRALETLTQRKQTEQAEAFNTYRLDRARGNNGSSDTLATTPVLSSKKAKLGGKNNVSSDTLGDTRTLSSKKIKHGRVTSTPSGGETCQVLGSQLRKLDINRVNREGTSGTKLARDLFATGSKSEAKQRERLRSAVMSSSEEDSPGDRLDGKSVPSECSGNVDGNAVNKRLSNDTSDSSKETGRGVNESKHRTRNKPHNQTLQSAVNNTVDMIKSRTNLSYAMERSSRLDRRDTTVRANRVAEIEFDVVSSDDEPIGFNKKNWR